MWLVVADDRTGALEVAGELATFLGPVPVRAAGGPARPSGEIVVVDVASRHLDSGDAACRMTAALAGPARHRALKIDSTLRGNWADEAVAAQRAGGGRVLVVPALPRLGRACTNGVVTVDGVPVGAGDARARTWSARPADHLAGAGHDGDVAVLASAGAIGDWVRGDGVFAVVDGRTDEDLAAAGVAVAADESIIVVGSAAAVAAAVRASTAAPPMPAPVMSAPIMSAPIMSAPIMVACGSLHAGARAQLDVLAAARPDIDIRATGLPDRMPVTSDRADAAAAGLAAAIHHRLDAGDLATLVILGGDTAAAVLGDEQVMVGGVVAPGTPWARSVRWPGVTLVTRAGGFGPSDALVHLLAAESAEPA